MSESYYAFSVNNAIMATWAKDWAEIVAVYPNAKLISQVS